MTAIQPYAPPAEIARIDSPQDIAIQRLGEWARSADAAHGIATMLVQTSFCPDSFRSKAGEATAAILAGMEVGLQPMAALRSFDVIQGQAAPRAIALRAIVQAHGHEIVMDESTATRCVIRGRRRGSNEWQRVVWTLDRAKQLGVTNKPNWRNQPQAMLVARATSEIARLVASDAILGLPYSAEEVADGGGFDQEVADETTTPATPTGTQRIGRPRRPVQPVPDPAPEPSGLDEFHEDTTHNPQSAVDAATPITKPQQTKLHAALGDLNLTDRDDKLAFCGEFLDRTVGSSSDLTKDEAGRLLDHIDELLAARDDGTLPVAP